MSTQHTPGPWRFERQNASPTTGEWMIAGSKPGYLAEVRDCGSGNVQSNARLIAAAPELLDQLQIAAHRITDILLEDDGQAFKEARKALPGIVTVINKAKGLA